MSDSEVTSSAEDVSCWLQSVVGYVNDTQVSCLDFRNIPENVLNSNNVDIQPIFNSLVNSDVKEIHLGRRHLTDQMQNLSRILSQTKIKKLNLEYCQMTVEDLLSLIAALRDTHIVDLNLTENSIQLKETRQIRKFVSYLVHSSLKSLSLSWSNLLPFENESFIFFSSLPDTRITCLDLSAFAYFDKHYSHEKRTELLCTLISKLEHTAITDLNLGWNRLDDFLAKAIGDVLEKTKLKKINLRNNNITDSGVDFFVSRLKSSNITHLNLSKNSINGDNSLGHYLRYTKIMELDLSRNSITNGKIFSCPNFLQNSAVRVLKLSHCFHSDKIISLHVNELRFSELICLDLSGVSLKFEHVSALADVLANSKLTHVCLNGSRISEESFTVLGECLIKSRLKYINLRFTLQFNNRIRSVASFLNKTKNSPIVALNLRNNDLSRDIDIIASALLHTTFLSLDLEANHFGNGIVSLAKVLKFTAITEMNLNYNDIEDDGAIILANSLEETQIVQLSLCNNSITSRGAKALAVVIKKSKLRQLDLRNNKIENDGLDSLAEHALGSCITYINVKRNPGDRKLLIDRVMWENRKKIQIFADLLKRTAFFTGDSSFFEFDRNFNGVEIDDFIFDCLKLYKNVVEEPFIVNSIEQDKCISDLKNLKRFEYDFYSYSPHFDSFVDEEIDIFSEDCAFIYKKILEQSSSIQISSNKHENVSTFSERILYLLSEEFPRKFVSFVGRDVEADVTQHVSFLRKIEELGLTGIVELLLLNRPLYVIEENQNILHPYVYQLLFKYKQPICNTAIEPGGVEKITEYFMKHDGIDGASDVIYLLAGCVSR